MSELLDRYKKEKGISLIGEEYNQRDYIAWLEIRLVVAEDIIEMCQESDYYKRELEYRK